MLEDAYAELMRNGPGKTPVAIVTNRLSAMLRNAALTVRRDLLVPAHAELFFRTSSVTLHEGC